MKTESVTVAEEQNPIATLDTPKRTWVEPEITWHQELRAVTLAIQCATTFPRCTSVTTTLQ